MPYILEHMSVDDISEVARIERLCFSMPWPISAYRRELKTPDTNRYIVARYIPPDSASALGMPTPAIQNLTKLNHSFLVPQDGQADQHNGDGGRSFLNMLLPWLRSSDASQAEREI